MPEPGQAGRHSALSTILLRISWKTVLPKGANIQDTLYYKGVELDSYYWIRVSVFSTAAVPDQFRLVHFFFGLNSVGLIVR